jgi:glyoxylase-like metal-dependent hydrolase (beta-lactamase superfamily II)
MRPIPALCLTAALALTSLPALAGSGDTGRSLAQAASEVQIEAQGLNDTLTMLYGTGGFSGGNVLVSNGPDGMLIIDDKIPDMTNRLILKLNEIGGMERLKFVLNTHWHFDHAGGNARLGKDAIIVAHENVRKRLSTEQRLDAFNMVLPPQPKEAWPVITYDRGASIHFNGEELKLVHLPGGHTDTDTVVYFTNSNVLHTGDLFFNGLFPFVDVQNGGSVTGVMENVATILATYPADVTIVPGHGPLATMEDLKTFHAMLGETIGNVRDMIAAGKDAEAIKAAGVPAKWKGWAGILNEATWNAIIHASLTK